MLMQMEYDLQLLNDRAFGPISRLIWEKSRFGIHQVLKDAFVGYDTVPQELVSRAIKNDRKRLWKIGRLLRNGLFCGWIGAPRRREWLVIPSGRRHIRIDGYYEEIYTEDIIQEIGVEKCLVLDSLGGKHGSGHRPYRVWFTETDRLIKIAFYPVARLKVAKERKKIRRMSLAVSNYLNERLGTSFDFRDYIYKIAISVVKESIAKGVMLTSLRPKKVLLVCSYGREELITCAAKRGIPTVEIQHGVITREHLGYAVRPGNEKKAFPDYVLLFGAYWKKTVPWPVDVSRLFVIGFPYFQRFRDGASLQSKRNLIVCISQDKIGSRMVDFALQLANTNPYRFKIVYKLHQNEEDIWKEIYPKLVEAERAGLLKVVDTNKPTLYSLLVSAQWQIGVNSTGVFEGLALNCRTVLIDAPGVEYMEPLMDSNAVQVVSKPEEIDWERKSSDSVANSLFESDWRPKFREFSDARLTVR
jgi:hypothetical protein